MSNKGLAIWPEKNDWNGQQYDAVVDAFSDLAVDIDPSYGVPRGGWDIPPSLVTDLKLVGEIAAAWILAGIGSDLYKALKKSLIKLYKVKLKRRPDSPAKHPAYLLFAITIEFEKHNFIFYFPHEADEQLITEMLEAVPETVVRLSEKELPNHFLLSWSENGWHVDVEQSLDENGYVIGG
jgi:hypothetical protein